MRTRRPCIVSTIGYVCSMHNVLYIWHIRSKICWAILLHIVRSLNTLDYVVGRSIHSQNHWFTLISFMGDVWYSCFTVCDRLDHRQPIEISQKTRVDLSIAICRRIKDVSRQTDRRQVTDAWLLNFIFANRLNSESNFVFFSIFFLDSQQASVSILFLLILHTAYFVNFNYTQGLDSYS